MNQELRQIIWKESYLAKRLVVVLVALGFVGIIGIALESDLSHRVYNLLKFVNVLTIVVAFAIGATMFAGESEYNTDRLLQRFGVSPGSIWQGKFLVGFSALLVLWISLTVFAELVDFLLKISLGQSRYWPVVELNLQMILSTFGLAFEALLCGILCSCWFKRVLSALVCSVSLFFISLLVTKYTLDGIHFYSARSEEISSILTHVFLIFLLIAASWFSIYRWFTEKRRDFSLSIPMPRFRSRITSRFHECSPQVRFITRILWYELRQHAMIWLAAACLSILFFYAVPFGSRFVVCYVAPLLMGLVSCYSEQNRDRARFWYQRGASTATYWWSKNILWLAVLFLLFYLPGYYFSIDLPYDFIPKYYSREYNEVAAWFSVTTAPQLRDFPSNLWFYMLLLYFIGQWAIVRLPHAVLAAICAVAGSLFGIALMHLCQVGFVPLWLVSTPVIIALAISSFWACEKMLRDLPDPSERHRRRLVLFPVTIMLCLVLFCGYRTRGVATMLIYGPHYFYEKSYSPEKILASSDETYSDRYFELVGSFPDNLEIERRAAEIAGKKSEQSSDFAKLEKIELNKLYKEIFKEQEKTIHELAHLLDSRYKSNRPMQINLLKHWRPKPDFQKSSSYAELCWPGNNFFVMLRAGMAQEEWTIPLSTREMIRLLWNLGEAHRHLKQRGYGSVVSPGANYFVGARFYTKKNLQRLYEQEDAASLRELIEESIQRETRITSMQQIVDLWFAYANYQLDHDNEYVWEYLRGIPWTGKDKAERLHEQYLIEKLLFPPRWTILPTEKFRARTLLYDANGFYAQHALLYDRIIKNQIAVDSVSDQIENLRKEWLQTGDRERLFGSTWAVYDLSSEWEIKHNYDMYVDIFSRHRMQRTMFALLAFAKEKNRYPEKLEELVPDYLEKLPVDPWTGKPFGYIGPNFTGIIVLPNKQDDQALTGPLLWKGRSWGRYRDLELVETAEKSQPPRYVFASRRRYQDLILSARPDKDTTDFGTFEEKAEMLAVQPPFIRELPQLSKQKDRP